MKEMMTEETMSSERCETTENYNSQTFNIVVNSKTIFKHWP